MLGVAAAISALLGLLAGALHVGRTRVARLLHGGRIDREVRALFGERAEVTHVAIDARWRLVLGATNLAIPGGLTLDVKEARLRGPTRAGAIVVESCEGTLRFRSLEAKVSYRVREAPSAPLDGSLVARGATWRVSAHPERGAREASPESKDAPPFDFEGSIRVSKESYEVVATRVACDGAIGTFELRGANGPPRAVLRGEGVGARLLDALIALAGPSPLAVPRSAKVAGELTIEPDFTRRLDATVATPTSSLAANLRLSAQDDLAGSKVAGTLSFADAIEARILAGRLLPRPEGAAALDLAVSGTLADWKLAGPCKAPRLVVEPLTVTDATAIIDVSLRGVRWSGFEATLAGGRLQGSGSVERGEHASELRAAGVRVEELPLGEEPLLRGLATAELTLRGSGDSLGALEGSGALEVLEPEYPFLRRASASLATFGLPPLPTKGAAPLRAQVALAKGLLRIQEIAGRVEGMAFSGSLALAASGELSGRIEAHLEDRYLANSVLLVLPAIFTGRITIPLIISGTASAPRYEADLVGTLGKLVSKNSVTGALGGIVDGLLGNIFGGLRDRRDDEDGKRSRR